jgi:superfamily II DNA or RNA helicase
MECLDLIQSKAKEGLNRQMVVLPTGAGKTVIFSELIRRKSLKTLVIAHRIELLEQAEDKLLRVAPDIDVGIFSGDQKCHHKQVTIASIQSASNALDLLKAEGYQLLIIDEAHHAAAKTYQRLIKHLGFHTEGTSPKEAAPEVCASIKPYLDILGVSHLKASPTKVKGAYRQLAIKYHPDKNGGSLECAETFKKIQGAYEFLIKRDHVLLKDEQVQKLEEEDPSKPVVVGHKKLMVGFTATPRRGDRVGLRDIFQDVVFSMSIRKLVHRGFLVKPEGLHVKVGIDLKGVRTQMGDFKKASLRKVMLSDQARGIVIETMKRFAADRRGIVFSVDIEHSELLKKDIQAAGFSCDAVHSKVSPVDRKQRLEDFASGKLQFIVNPMILTEGFYCPRADCMINAAPTKNKSLYIQKAGRVLRTHPEKENALLIDFGTTKKKHKLATAVDRPYG